MKYLQVGMNKLLQFPKVDERGRIKVLNLEHNLIKSIPTDISNYHNLANLNASYNQITAIPKDIQYLSSLKDNSLDLSNSVFIQAIIPSTKLNLPNFYSKSALEQPFKSLNP